MLMVTTADMLLVELDGITVTAEMLTTKMEEIKMGNFLIPPSLSEHFQRRKAPLAIGNWILYWLVIAFNEQ